MSACPICKKENSCENKTGKDFDCWCIEKKVPKALLESLAEFLTEPDIDKNCICQACIEKFNRTASSG